MIPKIIHYCWFGRNSLPKIAKKCLKSWKKYCPDYEIREWNEDNYDISSSPLYVRQAYKAKKWAFLTDYIRLDVVNRYGGIYLDIDVEVIKKLDALLENRTFFGLEGSYVNTGIGFGSEPNSNIICEIMEEYQTIPFILPDNTYDTTTCPVRNTKVFSKKGMIPSDAVQRMNDGTVVYPEDYFCPIDYYTGKLKITQNTLTIHHFYGSWIPEKRRKEIHTAQRKRRLEQLRYTPNRALLNWLGEEKYNKLKSLLKK